MMRNEPATRLIYSLVLAMPAALSAIIVGLVFAWSAELIFFVSGLTFIIITAVMRLLIEPID